MSQSARVVLFFGVILDPGVIPPAIGVRVFPVWNTNAPLSARSHAVALTRTVRYSEEGCALVADPLGSTFAPLPFNAAAEIRDFLVRHDLAHRVDRTVSRLGAAEWLVAPVYG
jgi:hypothetical protein